MSAPVRQPAGVPTGGQFAGTAHSETGTRLDPVARRVRHVDRTAATTTDGPTQLRLAQNGDTAQRELLQQNPNLTLATLTHMVDHWTFNPSAIPAFAAQTNMTHELRARIRPW